MKFRLTEGGGECRYLVGVDDDGTMPGLNQIQLDQTLQTVNQMASELNAETKIIRRRQCGPAPSKWAVELLVRQIPPDRQSIQHRVAVLGNVDAGKSTLVGVLTNGELDNGKGKSRLQMFRHPHEITSGRTSSISVDLLRFKTDGPIHGTTVADAEEATKIVEFWDLAGDMRYMKTTVYGLTSSSPDVVMLVISANKGVQGTTMEQLQIAKALHLPIFVVVTKIDLCSESQIQGMLARRPSRSRANFLCVRSGKERGEDSRRTSIRLSAHSNRFRSQSRQCFQNLQPPRQHHSNLYNLLCQRQRA